MAKFRGILQEFKDFSLKGNVVDMAVGVMIGAAFGKIVTSLVNDILMPPLGLVTGRLDFSNLYINLSGQAYKSLPEAQAAGAATINYGLFLNTIVNFAIVAMAIFLLIRQINRLRSEPQAPAPACKHCPYCISEIPIAAVKCAHCTADLSK